MFSEVQLITFNTKITHLGDAPAPLGRVGLRRRRGGEKPRVMGYPGDGPAPPTLYPSNCRYSREAANELFTESRRRGVLRSSSTTICNFMHSKTPIGAMDTSWAVSQRSMCGRTQISQSIPFTRVCAAAMVGRGRISKAFRVEA